MEIQFWPLLTGVAGLFLFGLAVGAAAVLQGRRPPRIVVQRPLYVDRETGRMVAPMFIGRMKMPGTGVEAKTVLVMDMGDESPALRLETFTTKQWERRFRRARDEMAAIDITGPLESGDRRAGVLDMIREDEEDV